MQFLRNYYNYLRKLYYFNKFFIYKKFFFKSNKIYSLNFKILNQYFISTEKGVFHIYDDKAKKIFNLPCFGIAFSNNKIFLSSADYFNTYIYSLDYKKDKEDIKFFNFEILYKKQIRYFGDRIHQIFLEGNLLYFASTSDDSLMAYNLDNKKISEIYKISNQSAKSDNHINSVRYYKDSLFFIYNNFYDLNTHKRISLIIQLNKNLITKYYVPYKGIHDLHFDNKNMYISVTFGNDEFPYSFILKNTNNLDKSYFSKKNFVMRGISGNPSDEMIFGSSNKGPHFRRFKGKSHIIYKNENGLTSQKFFSSQIYDIVKFNNNYKIENIALLQTYLKKISYKIDYE